MGRASAGWVFVVLALALAAARAEQGGGTITLKELFGVSHPAQLVEFDLPGELNPKAGTLARSDGESTLFQVLASGKLALLTDLPGNAAYEWKLSSAKAGGIPGAVSVTLEAAGFKIENGSAGIVIPAGGDGGKPLAPIQGLRLPDGTWTAGGPNELRSGDGSGLTGPRLRWVERGPLKVVVELTYAGGAGSYKSAIEVQAGQPSILFEEEAAEADVSYSVDAFAGLRPTQARYRGHGSTSVAFGRTADGQQYPGGGLSDGIVDLTYDRPKASGPTTTETTWRRVEAWNPWPKDGGFYWMMYDAAAPESGNVLGIFAGRASRAVGASHSGVGIFTAPGQGGAAGSAGLTVTCARTGPTPGVFPRVRFAWGLFVGTKGKDLLPPEQVQPIGRQWNLHAGVNLNKVHRIQLDYPDPPGGYGGMFMEPAALRRLVERLRADKSGPQGGGYHQWLRDADPYAWDLVEMWADPTGGKNNAAVAGIRDTARGLLDAYVNDRGIFHSSGDQMAPSYAYWMGALEMLRKGLWIDQVLADAHTTPEDRAKVKAVAALFATLLWDDDYVPLFEGHGMQLGNPNMPVMQQGVRNLYTLFLADHPAMAPRVDEVERRVLASLHEIVNEHGAEMGSVNYIGASFSPTLNTLLQLRMRGRDHFKSEPRLARFAEFYMHLLTPPEVRFGGRRKLVAIGDGSTQAPAVVGPLATGFRDADPALAARLTGAWHAAGKPHSSFFGTTLLQVDEDAPAADPALGDATFPGWCSVLRHGWGTPDETALWVVNGDFYHDHRHVDHGSIVLYALGAPLSLDWGPSYSPQVVGAFMHNTVVPEANIARWPGTSAPPEPHGWDQDNPPLETGNLVWGLGPWTGSTQESFVSFGSGAQARSRFRSPEGRSPVLGWTRTTTTIRADEAHPIIVIRDAFDGPDAATPKVFSLNLMAQGDVDTPAGKMTPTPRTFDAWGGRAPDKKELPSAGPVFPLAAGLSRLRFTGQWLNDWDLYVLAAEPQQAHIGNWGHYWHPNPEQVQFQAAQGRPFEERQHILRVRGTGGFHVLILPYRKGEPRGDVRVSQEGDVVRVTSPQGETLVGADFYAFSGGGRHVVGTFGTSPAAAHGISVDGGAAEVVVEGDKATVALHGEAGARRVALPGDWNVAREPARPGSSGAPPLDAGAWVLDYAGDGPATVTFSREAAGSR